MSKSFKKKIEKNTLGLIVTSVGAGIIIAVVIPVCGWIIAVGAGLIYLGWYLIEHCHN
ncbi:MULTISPECIES: hypothetical protein [Clostridium]|uniref:hypothetical protein n=1 Tax=Clostridium TaxID=1485 RepID=UPI000AE1E80B|nr:MULTISPECIES: hypothetical protein [Clostridium]MCD2346017.1 hypothetical protein [Clostridium guangxiense]